MADTNREFERYMSNLGEATNYAGDGVYQSPRMNRRFDDFRAGFNAARATPPSPSTAPDGKLRPRYKADGNRVVREHGGLLAQTHIPAEAVHIANALNEQAERLSSRPAEVDDEGLLPLPSPAYYDRVTARMSGDGIGFTAEQYRQGQRDAVAAYKKKQAALQELADQAQENDMGYGDAVAADRARMLRQVLDCYSPDDTASDYQDKIRALMAVPSHTTNKEK